MRYFFQKGLKPEQLVVAFHGTGGNEYQLLSTIAALYPQASVLSYLGNEGTGNHRRFFAPLEKGQLPRANFHKKITMFLEESWHPTKLYDEVIFIGYSNGANFILGLLEQEPTIANTAILLHPSNLGYQYVSGQFATRIIITSGAQDEISVAGRVLSLANQLKKHFPVDFLLLDGGHEVTLQEINELKELL
ncbi:alpha/beta hydrolase [Enterococcus faecalis]